MRGVGRRQTKGSGAAGGVCSPELRHGLPNPVNHPMSWSIKYRLHGRLPNAQRMPQPYARSSRADRCRAGATGDARGIIPLARRRRIYGCLVSASGGQGDDLPAPAMRGVGRRQTKGSGAADGVCSAKLRHALPNRHKSPDELVHKAALHGRHPKAQRMPQPYARSSGTDRCRAGATGDARGIIPLARRRRI
jgi:hypothetical protein